MGNDPINARDPSGMDLADDIGAILSFNAQNGTELSPFDVWPETTLAGGGGGAWAAPVATSSGAVEVAELTITLHKVARSSSAFFQRIGQGVQQVFEGACGAARPSNGGSTLQVGLAAGGTAGVAALTLSFGIATDTHGNVALFATGGAGFGFGLSQQAGLTVQTSNARSVQDLAGPFAGASGGGGFVLGGTIDTFAGSSKGRPIVGGGFTVGEAAGGAAFVGGTTTGITPSLPLGRLICGG